MMATITSVNSKSGSTEKEVMCTTAQNELQYGDVSALTMRSSHMRAKLEVE